MSRHTTQFKQEIIDKIYTYQEYQEIDDFFNFVLSKIISQHDKHMVISLLTDITSILDDGVQYDIVTDTLDYLTGYYGSLNQHSSAYQFVEKLSKIT